MVFSSLTPHRTGPNHTAGERKSYILQYAHDRAVMLGKEGEDSTLQDDPDRQFAVIQAGKYV